MYDKLQILFPRLPRNWLMKNYKQKLDTLAIRITCSVYFKSMIYNF